MRTSFGLSFQEVARASGKKCSCGSRDGLESVPQAHARHCSIAKVYAEWQSGCLELWERVKHVVVKRKGQEVFEDYPGQAAEYAGRG